MVFTAASARAAVVKPGGDVLLTNRFVLHCPFQDTVTTSLHQTFTLINT